MFKFKPISGMLATGMLLLILAGNAGSVRAKDTLASLAIHMAGGQEITYQIEIADTEASRQRGLMFRMEMPSNHGMLLDFGSPQKVSIWMKNTYIPLDIIYIDAAGIIAKIVPDAVPHSTALMNSDTRVRAVLEVNAGQAAYHGFKAGDQVIHQVFKPGTSE